jgi:hypothetical protein
MRPYLVLCAVVLMAVVSFGQQAPPVPRVYSPCLYGCGPYIPLITTPMISLQSVSPNPVGARNATTGLVAGATNSTLSQIEGSTSSEYTVPVWYQGGDAPLTSPQIHLYPQPIGHAARFIREEREVREMREAREEQQGGWLYFSGSEHTSSAADASSAAKGGKKATHVYTNEDVERQNQNNGTVKVHGKTEKM